MVLAIIQPPKLDTVRDALAKIGVTRLTVVDGQGYARQRGRTATYRGVEYKTHLLRKILLEIIVNDDYLDRTLETIQVVARTGHEGTIGDGKVLVIPIERVVQISDRSEGMGAV